MNGFTTPPAHVNFLAKKLFGNAGELIDGAIAYLEPKGGGSTSPHTHAHNYLFIVVKGEARITLGESEKIIRENESFLVEGNIPHNVWNNISSTTILIGISVRKAT